jgi:hypothetical protein
VRSGEGASKGYTFRCCGPFGPWVVCDPMARDQIQIVLHPDLRQALHQYMQVEGIENRADAIRTLLRVGMSMNPSTTAEVAARQAAFNSVRKEVFRSLQTWLYEQAKLIELSGKLD